jgi:hypothetical protein
MQVSLKKMIGVSALFALLVIAYVLIDYSFNLPKPKSYRFQVPALDIDRPVILQQDTMMVIVAHYSEDLVSNMRESGRLSRIASSFRQEDQLVDDKGYFVALGYGTQQGCPLKIEKDIFRESCSDSSYNWLGQSVNPGLYKDLEKVDYRFSKDFSLLTIE